MEGMAMKRVDHRIIVSVALALMVGTAGDPGAKAQQAPPVKRTVLLKQDTTVPGREAVMATVELPPGSAEGRHTHFAEVYVFVQEGTITLAVEGQPTKTFKAGEVFTIAPGVIHEGSNKGDAPARLAVVFFAEKGKPLSTPVQ
jgi:quercetin dioxygenase-like cupin family protein